MLYELMCLKSRNKWMRINLLIWIIGLIVLAMVVGFYFGLGDRLSGLVKGFGGIFSFSG